MLRLGKLECSGGFLLAAALFFYMGPGDLIPLAALAAWRWSVQEKQRAKFI